jgi:hypothetical protein
MSHIRVWACASLLFVGTMPVFAQDQPKHNRPFDGQADAATAQVVAPATTGCSWAFVSGSANTYLAFCVTANGNITYLETPVNHRQIDNNLAFVGEGYGLCDSTAPATYYDYAYTDSGNWNSTSVLSQTATAVKLKRTTSDGAWTLTQTITQMASSSSAQIVMNLKNNTATTRNAFLLRYADINADDQLTNNGDGTTNGAFIWNSSPDPSTLAPAYGLALMNVGNVQFSQWGAFAQGTPDGPNPCAFANSWTGGNASGNLSAVLVYAGSVQAHGTKTVTVNYKGL